MAQRASAQSAPAGWRDHHWWSNDGIRLHARIYGGAAEAAEQVRTPVICLPGLTRNARDFDRLAPHLADQRMVIAVSFRGRGDSGYARDAMTYGPLTYVQDVVALLDGLGISRTVSIGTSLGGLVTMLLAATQPGRIAGAVLNDIGPDIDPAGLARIRGYVGQISPYPTWMHVVRAIAEGGQDIYPDWTTADWLTMAKRSHRLTPEGVIVPDYDGNIAQPFRVPGGEAGVDLWPAFAALKSVPTLVVRGALSDILAPATVKKMTARLDMVNSITIPRVGHAPTLDEAAAVAGIDALLDRVDGAA
ncbi:MAG: alpha/beta hydrolase [Sphingopyxis sp.]|jgi:pimeloyl-ACP methyl ester carboxylesterase|nr:alpha/beta hydrolase [Sphingopyxis sp.]